MGKKATRGLEKPGKLNPIFRAADKKARTAAKAHARAGVTRLIAADNRRPEAVRFIKSAVEDIRNYLATTYENHGKYVDSLNCRLESAITGDKDPSDVPCELCDVGSANKRSAVHTDPLCKKRLKTPPWLKAAAPHLRQKLSALAARVTGGGPELQDELAIQAPPGGATLASAATATSASVPLDSKRQRTTTQSRLSWGTPLPTAAAMPSSATAEASAASEASAAEASAAEASPAAETPSIRGAVRAVAASCFMLASAVSEKLLGSPKKPRRAGEADPAAVDPPPPRSPAVVTAIAQRRVERQAQQPAPAVANFFHTSLKAGEHQWQRNLVNSALDNWFDRCNANPFVFHGVSPPMPPPVVERGADGALLNRPDPIEYAKEGTRVIVFDLYEPFIKQLLSDYGIKGVPCPRDSCGSTDTAPVGAPQAHASWSSNTAGLVFVSDLNGPPSVLVSRRSKCRQCQTTFNHSSKNVLLRLPSAVMALYPFDPAWSSVFGSRCIVGRSLSEIVELTTGGGLSFTDVEKISMNIFSLYIQRRQDLLSNNTATWYLSLKAAVDGYDYKDESTQLGLASAMADFEHYTARYGTFLPQSTLPCTPSVPCCFTCAHTRTRPLLQIRWRWPAATVWLRRCALLGT